MAMTAVALEPCPGHYRAIAMSCHDCAQHGHAERPGPWSTVCCYCGLPLPRKIRVGHWVALGEHSRVRVPR